LSIEVCQEIFQIQQAKDSEQEGISEDPEMTLEVMEVLGMLGLFLNRDRKSLRDASRFDPYDLEAHPYTTKALADCAMYCGTIRWLSEDDKDEEGIWTCLLCLHRWQKRGPREAYQTRKLMHPMTLIPFSREEHYDVDDWDNIMKATSGAYPS